MGSRLEGTQPRLPRSSAQVNLDDLRFPSDRKSLGTGVSGSLSGGSKGTEPEVSLAAI